MSWINKLFGRTIIEDILAYAKENKPGEIGIRTQVESDDITDSLDEYINNQKTEYRFYVVVSANEREYKLDEFEWTCQSRYKDNYASIKKFKIRNLENAVEIAERLNQEGFIATVNSHSIEEAKKYIFELEKEVEKRMGGCY